MVPNLFELVITLGILTQGGVCNHKMAAMGGRARHTERGYQNARENMKTTPEKRSERLELTLMATVTKATIFLSVQTAYQNAYQKL